MVPIGLPQGSRENIRISVRQLELDCVCCSFKLALSERACCPAYQGQPVIGGHLPCLQLLNVKHGSS
jgi:hypothetical protein